MIRREDPSDQHQIYQLNKEAFESEAEAKLVDQLRLRAAHYLGFVVEEDGQIVGHICFTEVRAEQDVPLMGLAPMAVAKTHQRQGIGSRLVEAGLEHCRERGIAGVVVLGHPTYYPRFGFKPASQFGIRSSYDVPDDVFMAIELKQNALKLVQGTVHYHEVFAELD